MATQATAPPPSGWIYRPGLDLLVGCGAWSAPLLLLAYPFRDSSTLAISGAFYALALLFNYPHYMATVYRAYHQVEDFRKYRVFTVHATLLLVATSVAVHLFPRWLPWIYTAYLTWSPWHYMGQNFGLAMMFARRNGVAPDSRARNALYVAFLASYFMVFLSMHGRPSNDAYVLSLGIPAGGLAARLVLAAVFLGAGIWAFRAMAAGGSWRPLLPSLALFSTEMLWFVLPTLLEAGYGFRIPQQRYADGVLALMHSAQYLWITSYYARREAAESSRFSYWGYFAVLVVGGIALFVPGPWLLSRGFGHDFTASFLTFTALVNLHHFILDGAVWKLRDGRIAALLIGRQAAESAGRHPLLNLPRALRWTLAGLLLAWAGLDQVKYALMLDGGNVSRLARAGALNPQDSSVWLRMAQAQAAAGHHEESRAALERALRVNPYNADAQRTLARHLLEHRKFAEAEAHYQQMSRYVPLDAASWFNFGVLAFQNGDLEDALARWQESERLDSSNPNVHLHLADAYDRLGRTDPAIRHYERYLVTLAARRGAPQVERQGLLLVSVKLADAYARAKRLEPARSYYERSALLARQLGDRSMESLSYVRLAETAAALGDNGYALRNFQAALQLDAALDKPESAGADWLAYGQFLRRIGAPPRLALAALLKAEELLKERADPAARRELEDALGAEAGVVRRNLESVVKDAQAYGLSR